MLSRSGWQKITATAIAVLGFVLAYQATILDSRYAARQALLRDTSMVPTPGARLRFTATAYCKGQVTASGVAPRTGVAAADPTILPVGSVIQVMSLEKYSGVYTIMDTGPAVQGRIIDIYMWNCYEALAFGRRTIDLRVIRLGWNPRSSPANLSQRYTGPSRGVLPAPPRPSGPAGSGGERGPGKE
ncbi:MAG: 3D domain-containing protein [Acidobacteriota bacterium]